MSVRITVPSLPPSPKVQPEQVIRCSSIAHLVHKTCEQGQASGLKKSPPFGDSPAAHLSQKVVFFSPPLHTPQPHFTLPLLHTRCASFGAHRGVAACFVAHRSLNPHPWLLLPPLIPNKVFADAHTLFERGQPPLIVLLTCGSLGLIGVSHFL